MPEREKLALPGRGPELGVWRPWNPGIGGLGPVWPGLGRFPGLADFGVLETPNFPLLPGYRKTRFWGPPTGNSRNSVEFSKKQQKTAYFPLLQANSGGYPSQTGQLLGPGGQFWGPRPGEANSGVRDPRIRDSPRFVHLPEIGRFPGFLGFGRIRRIPRFRVFWHFVEIKDALLVAAFDCWLRKRLIHQRISAQRFLTGGSGYKLFAEASKTDFRTGQGRASYL